VFLDPPYGKGLGDRTLTRLPEGGWIAKDALIVFESGAAEDAAAPDYDLLDERAYGAAKVRFLKLKA
jgi:16S rRNA (guanine966-N2)-methyltransferase